MADCREDPVITHDTTWQPASCIDGGIFRAKKVYTNLEASGFNTPVGYSGHFYGIRKYKGLIPNAPYIVEIKGKAGDGSVLEVPREIYEWEYGSNNNVNYSGIKLVGDDPYVSASGRNANDEYGKSVAVFNDLLAVGVPYHTLYDTNDAELDDAGAVFLYRRNPEPSGFDWSEQYDKAPWSLETKLTLPSGFLKDYYTSETTNVLDPTTKLPFNVERRTWFVGQEGRQFGHSVDISISGDKERIVVGAPSAKFTRTFEDLQPSGVNIGLFVFTDEFKNLKIDSLLKAIKDKDLLFKYFSEPSVSFNIKLIILEPDPIQTVEFEQPKPSFIEKRIIERHNTFNQSSSEFQEQNLKIYSGIKDAFETFFPYDNTKINNNIPPILGFYVDNSRSLGERAIQPALNNFIDYYKSYSFASGLKDFFDVASTGAAITYIGNDENWVAQATKIFNEVLDTGNLAANNQLRLFTSGITTFNENLNEFNVPPSSGGAVYVFEKESGAWSLIQSIFSPTEANDIPPDRFGHDVKISDNGEVIVVGSPYINDAIKVYEYQPLEKTRLYNSIESWIAQKKEQDTVLGYYYQMYDRYFELKEQYGTQAAEIFYLELNTDARYQCRLDNNIQEYKNTFTYGYSSIPYKGTWKFLLEKFASSSRLGYSVAVNEDGSIVAAGAPTDCLDEHDDTNTYYSPARPLLTLWHSYVNAGAVRLFESRKYYSHNKAIEYGKFGNLEFETSNEDDRHLFALPMSGIYKDMGVEFTKTEFADVDIPQDAGLVFIITPQVDALSDEIIANIKNWLALGDRHLVIVGNDPVWEKDSLYSPSNDILNEILSNLNSRMRIVPARNESESLLNGPSGLPNITKSFRPATRTTSYVASPNLYGSGVGDIKLYYEDGAEYSYSCSDKNYQKNNSKCEMPLVHLGDMRAQWNVPCAIGGTFPMNWPYVFGSIEYPRCESLDPNEVKPPSPTRGYDPVPILAAAEYTEPEIVIYPATPATSSIEIVGYEQIKVGQNTYYKFDTSSYTDKEFVWNSGQQDYNELDFDVTDLVYEYKFFDPELYNQKDPILQAKASNNLKVRSNQIVSDKAYYAAEEQYGNTTSKIILIAGSFTESPEVLLSDDQNINFYLNLVSKNVTGGSYIGQLNSWVNVSSFNDAYDKSILFGILNRSGNVVEQNITTEELTEVGHSSGRQYDIGWIANPRALPNTDQLQRLKNWLNTGNKKLIITYPLNTLATAENSDDYDYSIINRIKQLCEYFNVSMEPLYLGEKGRYALNLFDALNGAPENDITISTASYVYSGFRPEDRIGVIREIPQYIYGDIRNVFVPIKLNNATAIAYSDHAIIDNTWAPSPVWQLKTGIALAKFPSLPGSGYRLFFDIASEHSSEKEPITCLIARANGQPNIPVNTPSQYEIRDIDLEKGTYFTAWTDTGNTVLSLDPQSFDGEIYTYTADVQAVGEEIYLYFYQNDLRVQPTTDNYGPRTTRLISVSGALLPISQASVDEFISEPIYDFVVTPAQPEQTGIISSFLRPINTLSSKYCDSEDCIEVFGVDTLIEDGPVVVAQEIEQFSRFDSGFERSRITVISDSSLIQGRTIVNQDGVIHDEVRSFLQSLYPRSGFTSDLEFAFEQDIPEDARTFNTITKIVSPERGSPQKFYSSTGNNGNNLLFQTSSIASGKAMSEFRDYIDGYSTFRRALYPPDAERTDPTYLTPKPKTGLGDVDGPDAARIAIETALNNFNSYQGTFGGSAKFSGIIEGKLYEDVGVNGGLPELMKDKGYDYIEFDRFPSGYPGDLFGYSIDMQKEKLLIGAPFAAFYSEQVVSWDDVAENTPQYSQVSGTIIGYNGGAGSVYLYEKTGSGLTPYGNLISWNCTRKFRPNSINIGQDTNDLDLAASGFILGSNNYKSDDLSHMGIVGDQFGHAVKINSDIIVIGAPGHDFENYTETIFDSGAFIRKEFAIGFDIPQRTVYNLGESGIRYELDGSGVAVLNNGAIFTYENRITDWPNRGQSWEFIEKIVPQGYNSRLQKDYVGSYEIPVSGSENDRFGRNIAITRSFRSDADYSLVAGVPTHKFATSGDAETLLNAGAAYVYDGMLRRMPPSTAGQESFINSKVFADGDLAVSLNFTNVIPNQEYTATGIIYSNNKGAIFLEASGQDVVSKGYIRHRPYIQSIYGKYVFGTEENNSLNVFIEGSPFPSSGNVNLFSNAADSAIVYNTLGLYQSAVLGIASGVPSGLFLYTDCPSGITISESGFALYASGTGFTPENLNLRVRGK